MQKLFIFGILSIFLVILSRKSLLNFRSHGFYRFLSWECILWLAISNASFWFDKPFSMRQIVSWSLLIYSIYPVTAGTFLLRKVGRPKPSRQEESLYSFEKTTELVDTGIFKYIRHPLYSSLLFLTWGILLKNPDFWLIATAVASSIFLYLTAISDEKECIAFFGEKYRQYMKTSKRFIPFVF